MKSAAVSGSGTSRKVGLYMRHAAKLVNRDKYLLLLIMPAVIFYILFHYVPMYGTLIAFVNFRPGTPILSNEWVGLRWFMEFFNSVFFVRLMRNTIMLSVMTIIFNFPLPIIFALLLNEVRNKAFKKTVQTISYMPFFISMVVVIGILFNFFAMTDGVINNLRELLGMNRIDFLNDPAMFRPLFVGTTVWRTFGWNSIIYLAALSSIDPQLYEAAEIDGAGRFMKLRKVTLPGLIPIITIMLILAVGNVMSVAFEQVLLMQNPATLSTSDVIQTYVFRRGILGGQFSFSAAVGLFNSVINLILLVSANFISRKLSDNSLW